MLGPAVSVGSPLVTEVLIQRLDPDLPLPSYAHPGDAGADLVAASDITLKPGERGLVGTGIAIALLGRNHPVGMIFSALLWAALDASSNSLQGVGVPKELVTIMQGTVLFAVVIAYELVRRYRLALEQRDVARALAAASQEARAA